MDRTASLAVVFPLAHVARLFTVGTAAATVEARTTRERKIFENMAKLSKEEEKMLAMLVCVRVSGSRGQCSMQIPPLPPQRFYTALNVDRHTGLMPGPGRWG